MPDRRKHRGQHPKDKQLFAEDQHEPLRVAVGECAWLLTRGYARDSSLKLVGNRHDLTARQRLAVARAACSDQSLHRRRRLVTTCAALEGQPLGIDGYNLLITIESALADGVLFIGRDGCYRDLASVHGTYRKVEETVPALALIIEFLSRFNIGRVDWYLDRPVSNSGRLKALMADVLTGQLRSNAESRPCEVDDVGRAPSDTVPGWNIDLVDSPDAILASYAGAVATADSVVLDRCNRWVNLAAEIIDRRIPTAHRIDLRDGVEVARPDTGRP